MDRTLDTYRISDELSDYILSKNGFNYRITDPTLELLYQKFKTETIPSNPKKLYFKYSVSMPRRDDRNAIFEDFSTFPPITINFNGKPLTFKITNPTFSPQVPGPGVTYLVR